MPQELAVSFDCLFPPYLLQKQAKNATLCCCKNASTAAHALTELLAVTPVVVDAAAVDMIFRIIEYTIHSL